MDRETPTGTPAALEPLQPNPMAKRGALGRRMMGRGRAASALVGRRSWRCHNVSSLALAVAFACAAAALTPPRTESTSPTQSRAATLLLQETSQQSVVEGASTSGFFNQQATQEEFAENAAAEAEKAAAHRNDRAAQASALQQQQVGQFSSEAAEGQSELDKQAAARLAEEHGRHDLAHVLDCDAHLTFDPDEADKKKLIPRQQLLEEEAKTIENAEAALAFTDFTSSSGLYSFVREHKQPLKLGSIPSIYRLRSKATPESLDAVGTVISRAEHYQVCSTREFCNANYPFQASLHEVDCSQILQTALSFGTSQELAPMEQLAHTLFITVRNKANNESRFIQFADYPTLANPCWTFLEQCLPTAPQFTHEDGLWPYLQKLGLTSLLFDKLKGMSSFFDEFSVPPPLSTFGINEVIQAFNPLDILNRTILPVLKSGELLNQAWDLTAEPCMFVPGILPPLVPRDTASKYGPHIAVPKLPPLPNRIKTAIGDIWWDSTHLHLDRLYLPNGSPLWGMAQTALSANLIPIPDEYKHLTARLKECSSEGACPTSMIVDVLKGLNIKMINDVFASVSNSSDLHEILTQAITGMTGGAITPGRNVKLFPGVSAYWGEHLLRPGALSQCSMSVFPFQNTMEYAYDDEHLVRQTCELANWVWCHGDPSGCKVKGGSIFTHSTGALTILVGKERGLCRSDLKVSMMAPPLKGFSLLQILHKLDVWCDDQNTYFDTFWADVTTDASRAELMCPHPDPGNSQIVNAALGSRALLNRIPTSIGDLLLDPLANSGVSSAIESSGMFSFKQKQASSPRQSRARAGAIMERIIKSLARKTSGDDPVSLRKLGSRFHQMSLTARRELVRNALFDPASQSFMELGRITSRASSRWGGGPSGWVDAADKGLNAAANAVDDGLDAAGNWVDDKLDTLEEKVNQALDSVSQFFDMIGDANPRAMATEAFRSVICGSSKRKPGQHYADYASDSVIYTLLESVASRGKTAMEESLRDADVWHTINGKAIFTNMQRLSSSRMAQQPGFSSLTVSGTAQGINCGSSWYGFGNTLVWDAQTSQDQATLLAGLIPPFNFSMALTRATDKGLPHILFAFTQPGFAIDYLRSCLAGGTLEQTVKTVIKSIVGKTVLKMVEGGWPWLFTWLEGTGECAVTLLRSLLPEDANDGFVETRSCAMSPKYAAGARDLPRTHQENPWGPSLIEELQGYYKSEASPLTLPSIFNGLTDTGTSNEKVKWSEIKSTIHWNELTTADLLGAPEAVTGSCPIADNHWGGGPSSRCYLSQQGHLDVNGVNGDAQTWEAYQPLRWMVLRQRENPGAAPVDTGLTWRGVLPWDTNKPPPLMNTAVDEPALDVEDQPPAPISQAAPPSTSEADSNPSVPPESSSPPATSPPVASPPVTSAPAPGPTCKAVGTPVCFSGVEVSVQPDTKLGVPALELAQSIEDFVVRLRSTYGLDESSLSCLQSAFCNMLLRPCKGGSPVLACNSVCMGVNQHCLSTESRTAIEEKLGTDMESLPKRIQLVAQALLDTLNDASCVSTGLLYTDKNTEECTDVFANPPGCACAGEDKFVASIEKAINELDGRVKSLTKRVSKLTSGFNLSPHKVVDRDSGIEFVLLHQGAPGSVPAVTTLQQLAGRAEGLAEKLDAMQIQVPASEWEGASLARASLARQHVVIDVNAGTVTQFLSTDVVAQLQDAPRSRNATATQALLAAAQAPLLRGRTPVQG